VVPALFIAGTDTAVGKTVVTAGLAATATDAGLAVAVMKPVQTGTIDGSDDLATIARLAPKATALPREQTQLYSFPLPASPHLAAATAGATIVPERMVAAVAAARRRPDINLLLIEGAGGLLVPLRRDYLQIELIRELAIPVIMVARAGLGTINHTRLSIEALAARDIPLAGLIINRMPPRPGPVEADNLRHFRDDLALPILVVVPDSADVPAAVAAMRHDPGLRQWVQAAAGK